MAQSSGKPTFTTSPKGSKKKKWNLSPSLFNLKGRHKASAKPPTSAASEVAIEPSHQLSQPAAPKLTSDQEPVIMDSEPTLTATDARVQLSTTDTVASPKKFKKGKFLNRFSSILAKFIPSSSKLATKSVKETTQRTIPLSGSARRHESGTLTDVLIVPTVSDTLADKGNNEIDPTIVLAGTEIHITNEAGTEPTSVSEPQAPTDYHAFLAAEELIDQDPDFDSTWGPTRSIPGETIEELAMEHAPIGAVRASFLGTQSGLNNSVFFVEYHPSMERRCIRVPASGWDGKWSQEDRDQLTRSNNIMRYLRKHTAIPVPEIFHWDTELDNVIGAPYTIMAAVDGVSPRDLWFKGVYPEQKSKDNDDDVAEDYSLNFKRVKKVKGLEKRRQKILKSLATTLAAFQHLKFDKLGSISCPNGADGPLEVVPFSHLCYGRENDDNSVETGVQGEIFGHTIEALRFLLGKMEDRFEYDEENPLETEPDYFTDAANSSTMDADARRGLAKLYNIVICCLPIRQRSKPETFVLSPPDFGSGNILCNRRGKVIAILDWDCVDTRPRLMGWCMPPTDLLGVDWWGLGRYTWPNHAMAPDEIDRYRKDFAKRLRRACNKGSGMKDWKYSTRSPMFEAIINSLVLQDEHRMFDTMISLLRTFLPRMDLMEFMRQIGLAEREERRMGQDMRSYLYKKFQALFGNVQKDDESDDEEEDVEMEEESMEIGESDDEDEGFETAEESMEMAESDDEDGGFETAEGSAAMAENVNLAESTESAESTHSDTDTESTPSTEPSEIGDEDMNTESLKVVDLVWDEDTIANKRLSGSSVETVRAIRGEKEDAVVFKGGFSIHDCPCAALPKRRKSWSN